MALFNCASVIGAVAYFERDVLPEGDISRHSEVIKLQHVRDVFKPCQKLLNLWSNKAKSNQTLILLFRLSNIIT